MRINLIKFYQACNPSKTLVIENAEDRQYYIDFSDVRGGQIIEEMERTIVRLSPDSPTCQLFTGHIGCGKSTELLRLKYQLEQQGFHVVYFESSQDLVMSDVEITDILLAIAHQISQSLEKAQVNIQKKGLQAFLKRIAEFLKQTEFSGEFTLPGFIDIEASTEGELSISSSIGKLTSSIKNSTKLRHQLRQYIEPRTDTLLEEINEQLLLPAIEELKLQDKKGLVVIVDNLDRIDNKPQLGSTQPEYLFIERGDQLKRLNCHVIYTIPLVLTFSHELNRLRNRFGVEPKVLPMVRVKLRNGDKCEQGIELLKQMVLAKAFSKEEPEQRLNLIEEVFDKSNTLEYLCQISGGHVRNLLVMLFSCLQKKDPPISYSCLTDVIRRQKETQIRAITDDEWILLRQVAQEKQVKGVAEYQTLVRSMFVFEYQDEQGGWFGINPIFLDAKQLESSEENIFLNIFEPLKL